MSLFVHDSLLTCVCSSHTPYRERELDVQEPDPHISVAWLLGDQQANLQQHLADCKPMSPSWEQTVDQILCTVGQKKYSVWSIEDLKL